MKHRLTRPFGRLETCAVCALAAMAVLFGNGAALAEGTPKDDIQIVSTGNGSYICSPSGFGQKSRCSSR